MTYTFEFTASKTGTMLAGDAAITVSGPPTMGFFAAANVSGNATFDDLTSGTSVTERYFTNDAVNSNGTLTLSLPIAIAAGDRVKMTYTDVINGTSAGPQTLTLTTSSDTVPATAGFPLTAPNPVAAPAVTVSTQQPGGPATYAVTFTASGTGTLISGDGAITLTGPAGINFSPASYALDDITAQQSTGRSGSLGGFVTNNGTTVSFGAPFAIAAGDQIAITATGVTSPATSGQVAMGISTSSDTVTAAPGFVIGDSPPVFTQASPPLVVAAGSHPSYRFAVTGWPAPLFKLKGAPAWLSVQGGTGKLSGTVPAGVKSFSFSVTASNSHGTATEGPYPVTVGGGVTVAGQVVNDAGDPVTNVIVNACDPSGGVCESAITGNSGAFTVSALAGSRVVVTAYPPPGSGDSTSSTRPIEVPKTGLAGVTITTHTGIPPIAGGLLINGSSSPVVYWASPSTATMTGCPNGVALVSVIGDNIATGQLTPDVVALPESPAGSGDYTGTIPPQEPVHGPVDIHSMLWCPPSSPLVPDVGPATGGTTVIVTGSGFTGTTAVKFGTTAAASYTVQSDNAIQAVAPAGSGSVPVVVFDRKSPAGATAGTYTYQAVTSISPAKGPASGSTWVVIKGTGLLSAKEVRFGGTPALEYITLSGTELEALSPPGKGTQDITVDTLDGGTTPVTAADRFSYGGGATTRARTGTVPARTRPTRPATRTAAPVTRTYRSPGHVRSPAESPGGIGGLVVSAITYVANLLLPEEIGAELQFVQSLIADRGVTCDSQREFEKGSLLASLDPYIKELAKKATPTVRRLVLTRLTPFFIRLGVAGLIGETLIYAFTPQILHAVFSTVAGFVIDQVLNAVLGNCPPKNDGPLPPNLPPPPPPGSGVLPGSNPPGSYPHCAAPVLSCGFTPTGTVDPSGTILDTGGRPVGGATVTILRSFSRDGVYAAVKDTSPGIFPPENPEITGANGAFHWDVSAGFYKVQASAPGCTVPGTTRKTAVIGPYPVPPPQLGLTITLACKNAPKPPRPAVTSLSAHSGPPAGGTVISVLGSGFTPASMVTFDRVAARKVTYLSPQALTVTTPRGSGLVYVHVTNPAGASKRSAASAFFYGAAPSVTGVNPGSGPVGGGTVITITGTGFAAVSEVSIGGLPAKSFTVMSATRIRAKVPAVSAGQAGAVDVTVANPAGVSAPGQRDLFRYLAPVTAYVSNTAGVTAISGGRASRLVKIAGARYLAALPSGQIVYGEPDPDGDRRQRTWVNDSVGHFGVVRTTASVPRCRGGGAALARSGSVTGGQRSAFGGWQVSGNDPADAATRAPGRRARTDSRRWRRVFRVGTRPRKARAAQPAVPGLLAEQSRPAPAPEPPAETPAASE